MQGDLTSIVYLGLAAVLTLALSMLLVSSWIRLASRQGLVGKDMNKPGEVMVAEAGGTWALIAAVFGLLVLEALYTYTRGAPYEPLGLYSLIALLLLSAMLGFADDMLGWKKGLPRLYRVVFMLPIALPLSIAVYHRAGFHLPPVGYIDVGLLYPLVLVPVGVMGAANAFNMLAGYNGLEAGMGLLLMAFTGAYAAMRGVDLVFQASVVMIAALAGFLVYNWYPARVFPGNGFTYGLGAYYAGLVVLGGMEAYGLFLFTLYFVKAILYFRGVRHGVWRQGIEDFGRPQPDGSLEAPLEGAYSLQHLAIRLSKRLFGRATERSVVLLILAAQALIGVIGLLLAYLGVF